MQVEYYSKLNYRFKMDIGGSILGKFMSANFKILTGFLDMAYRQGWLLYLIFGLIGLVILIIFF